MKILYVEDNRLDADLTRRELKKSAPDFHMQIVATQHDALLGLEKKQDYDLVLADMRLPDGDGLSILTHIRGRGFPMAVVIITGQGDEETAVAALKAGAQDYVVKRDGYRDHLPLILEKALECYHESSVRSSQPLRLLYAEPHALDVDLTRRHLATFAPHITMNVVKNSSGVFEIFSDRHNEHLYDAILLDYRLPGLNALEILKELRQVHGTDLPIILITGQGTEEIAVQALKLGATDYVVKNQGYLYKIPSVLENAVHSVQLTREHRTITQLKHRNELILNSAGEGIIGLDLACNHTFVNPAAARMLGYEISEMIGISGHSLWHHTKIDGSPYNEETCTIYAACREGLIFDDQEDLFRRKDGTGFPVEYSLMPIREGGRLLGSVLTFRDISERKKAEEERQTSEQRHQSILKTAIDGFLMIDSQGRILESNTAYCRMSGYSAQELFGMRISDLEAAETSDDTAVHIQKVAAQGEDRFETRHRRKDGSIVDVEVSAQYRSINGGRFTVFLRDITERKHTEEKIRESEEKYRLLADNTVDCIWLMNRDLEFTYINPAIEPMMGFTPEEWIGSTLEDHCDNENFNKMIALAGAELDNPPHDEAMTFEAYMLNRDNKNIPLEIRSRVLYDEEGTPVGLQGTTRDITDRKEAEEKLQQTLERLRDAVRTTIQVMVSAVETRDPYTAGHQVRVAELARAIATEMKYPQDMIDGISMAGSIHDIGKLSIPAEILSKPTKLSEIEFSLIQQHPGKGYDILKDVESFWPLAEIVYQHHERINGSGYPRNLQGDEILMEARIMAVADVVEAMASHRPYRAALGIDTALKEIEDKRGILYDASVVDACLSLFREKGFQLKDN